MAEVFTNMDARWLQDFAEHFREASGEPNRDYDLDYVRFLQIARNLQSMDDRQGSEYARGFQDGKDSPKARSNILKNEGFHPDLESALASFKGEVTKIPPSTKQNMKPTLTVDDLDLDLGDL